MQTLVIGIILFFVAVYISGFAGFLLLLIAGVLIAHVIGPMLDDLGVIELFEESSLDY